MGGSVNLAGALELAARGWALIPLAGKLPTLDEWPNRASRDPATIGEWWSKRPTANAGIVTGAPSGIWVLDVDGDEGRASLAALVALHSPLPATFAVRTGRAAGGQHLYFRHPAGRRVVSRALRSRQKEWHGLDVKGDGGYVVAPGSVHPESGKTYEVEDRAAPIAETPAWLLALVAHPIAVVGAVEVLAEARRPMLAQELDGLARQVLRSAPERLRAARRPTADTSGNRNQTLNREAHGLAACGVPRDLAEPAMLEAARDVGMDAASARRTFES